MRFRPSCSARSFEMGTQIKPRPCIAMKFTDAAVAFSAAITRSPSFSRSASSVTITIFPEATSATTSSTASNSNVSGVVTCEITRANNCAGGRLRQLLVRSKYSGSVLSRPPSGIGVSLCSTESRPTNLRSARPGRATLCGDGHHSTALALVATIASGRYMSRLLP